ncbi:uncharacterized protein BDR25DRAFT_361777 [Lindgomyces ingoldianus]|uniref:Uncharacterized protein n=1 Tax=Lindgomyces ingoldianus TaxID=673940 RepID=A0ACB6QDS3_9PLEO|nr:uncharacterized protein BDR25DRAFT_361777 [Lindgomyces ingoldianus]KAF2464272.1 hypothetical protein BDR25DRAFT_361777 [Lindgomyces ingoldianus]
MNRGGLDTVFFFPAMLLEECFLSCLFSLAYPTRGFAQSVVSCGTISRMAPWRYFLYQLDFLLDAARFGNAAKDQEIKAAHPVTITFFSLVLFLLFFLLLVTTDGTELIAKEWRSESSVTPNRFLLFHNELLSLLKHPLLPMPSPEAVVSTEYSLGVFTTILNTDPTSQAVSSELPTSGNKMMNVKGDEASPKSQKCENLEELLADVLAYILVGVRMIMLTLWDIAISLDSIECQSYSFPIVQVWCRNVTAPSDSLLISMLGLRQTPYFVIEIKTQCLSSKIATTLKCEPGRMTESLIRLSEACRYGRTTCPVWDMAVNPPLETPALPARGIRKVALRLSRVGCITQLMMMNIILQLTSPQILKSIQISRDTLSLLPHSK